MDALRLWTERLCATSSGSRSRTPNPNDEIIWDIDEALGTSDSPKTAMRGWIKKAHAGDIRVFLGGIKYRLEHTKYFLTDTEHQEMLLGDGNEPESVVLRDTKKSEGDNHE